MDHSQERHLAEIKRTFEQMVDKKYRRGQAEHGGNLFDVPGGVLLDCAIDEAIDQVVYLLTMKQSIKERNKKT